MLKKNIDISTSFLLSFLGIGLLTMPILPSHRFILLSSLLNLFLTYIFFNFYKISLKIIIFDIGWFIFLFICFLSYSWAVNGALVWYPAFGYLLLILYLIVFRTLFNEYSVKKYLHLFLTIIFLINLSYIGIIMCLTSGLFEQTTQWNKYFGYNANYLSIYLVSLFPFFLFQPFNKKKVIGLKLFCLLFIIYIIYVSRAKGAAIAFSISILYFFCKCFPKKYLQFRLVGIIAFCSFIVIGLYSVITYLDVNTLKWKQYLLDIDLRRFSMLESSFRIFVEKPILGIGLGNWNLEAYNINEIVGYNVYNFERLGNHNLFSQYLAELGIIGFSAFFLPFLIALKSVKKNTTNNLQRAAFISLITYLIGSSLYRDANIYENYFSGLQFLSFINLAILSNGSFSLIKIKKKSITLFVLILSLACLIWFLFYFFTEKCYNKVSEINVTNTEETIELLESIYNPIFKTTHGYYKDGTGFNKSLGRELALLYQEQQNFEKTEANYIEALRYAPNDEYLILSYAKFLLRVRNNPKKAKEYLLTIYRRQNNNLLTNQLLAEAAVIDEKYILARKYLNTKYMGSVPEIIFLENKIYYSTYLEHIITLTSNQKQAYEQMKNDYEEEHISLISQLGEGKEIKDLANRIKINKIEQENSLFNLLTEQQFYVYLNDKSNSFYGRKLWLLKHIVNLTNSQLLEVESLLKENTVKRKMVEVQLRMTTESQKVKTLKNDFINFFPSWEKRLKLILSKRQYQKYQVYQNNTKIFSRY